MARKYSKINKAITNKVKGKKKPTKEQVDLRASRKARTQAGKERALQYIQQAQFNNDTGQSGITASLINKVMHDPEAYKALYRMQAQREKALKNNRLITKSYALQDFRKEKKAAYKNMDLDLSKSALNKPSEEMVAALLKFNAAKSSTPEGLVEIQKYKRDNFMNQLVTYGNLSSEQEQAFRELLGSMSNAKFNKLIKQYDDFFEELGYERAFEAMTAHLMSIIRENKVRDFQHLMSQFANDVHSYFENADAVDVAGKSVSEILADFGIEHKDSVLKTPEDEVFDMSDEDLEKLKQAFKHLKI